MEWQRGVFVVRREQESVGIEGSSRLGLGLGCHGGEREKKVIFGVDEVESRILFGKMGTFIFYSSLISFFF